MFRDRPEPRPAQVELRVRLDRDVFDRLADETRRKRYLSPSALARKIVTRAMEKSAAETDR
jgi:ribosomal protein S25